MPCDLLSNPMVAGIHPGAFGLQRLQAAKIDWASVTKFQKFNYLGAVQHIWHQFNHPSHLLEFAQ